MLIRKKEKNNMNDKNNEILRHMISYILHTNMIGA